MHKKSLLLSSEFLIYYAIIGYAAFSVLKETFKISNVSERYSHLLSPGWLFGSRKMVKYGEVRIILIAFRIWVTTSLKAFETEFQRWQQFLPRLRYYALIEPFKRPFSFSFYTVSDQLNRFYLVLPFTLLPRNWNASKLLHLLGFSQSWLWFGWIAVERFYHLFQLGSGKVLFRAGMSSLKFPCWEWLVSP